MGEKFITNEELRKLLHENHHVKFSYKKTNGEETFANGTINKDFIPEEKLPKEENLNKFGENIKYYDMDKRGWRSISYDCSTIKLL